ncbi:hypothetical protein [Salmonella phage Tennessee]
MGLLGVDTSLAPRTSERFEFVILHQIRVIDGIGIHTVLRSRVLRVRIPCHAPNLMVRVN